MKLLDKIKQLENQKKDISKDILNEDQTKKSIEFLSDKIRLMNYHYTKDVVVSRS